MTVDFPRNPPGLLAEFDDADVLVEAARRTREEGYRRVEAYSPFPVEGLAEALDFRKTRIALVVLVGGIVGCLCGYLLAYYCTSLAYPTNVGGRPANSWPFFIPVTFEVTILIAALSAVLGMLALNGLPRPHHPLFDVPQFDRASQDRFFLWIRGVDPKFHPETTRRFLQSLGACEVYDVPE